MTDSLRVKNAIVGTMVGVAVWMVLLGLIAVICAGCAGKNATFDERQAHMTNMMEALREANFKGQVRFNEGGSLLGVNAATNWSLGPQQVTLQIEGEVDFQHAPRPVEPEMPK